MGRALYRKYRSKKLSEIVGQQHITTSLANALKSGKIGHAYLFTGPRGTGKTSIARILAHEINELPYQDDANHLDIIEIDAASNRRIDEIRTLRDKIHNAPASAKYKIYIIDEVHMLTKEAFNALLKTLEEPPKHAIFILATTEAHKLPETIISRTQRFTFKPATTEEVASHLKMIAKTENFSITNEALELIAQHGGGSLRDSISMLDQARNSSGEVDKATVQQMLGIAPEQAIEELISALQTGSLKNIVKKLGDLKDQGVQASNTTRQLSDKLRQELINGSSSDANTTKLLARLLEVPASHDPYTLLEIILLDHALSNTAIDQPTPTKSPVKAAKSPIKKPSVTSTKEPIEEQPAPPKTEEKSTTAEPETSVDENEEISRTTGDILLDENAWQSVLLALKQKHNTLYGIARMAVPLLDGEKLTLSFKFPFHQKKFNDAKNKKILSEIFSSEVGISPEIISIVDATSQPKETSRTKPSPDSGIETISNIFGGAEVLE